MLRGGAIAFAVVVGILAAAPFTRTLMEDHQNLRDDKTPSIAEARAAFARHPLDYSAAAHIAYASTSLRERIAYLNHALRLSPHHPGLHRAVARWLAQAGKRSQAAGEYRRALMGTDDPETLVVEITTVFPVAAEAATAFPIEYPGWNRIATQLVESKRADVALAYLARIADAPGARPVPEVWRRMATIAQNARDLPLAERALAALRRIDPTLPGGVALAKIQLEQKAYDRAAATLGPIVAEPVTTKEHVEARVLFCEIRVVRATIREDWETARTCLIDVLNAPGVSMETRRTIHGHLVKVEEALGNHDQAELERRLAAPGKLAPEPPSGLRGSGGSR
jgi:tetratricopeptide (TPR) repeat protein